MTFTIKILARAEIEFESQVVYLHSRSPKGAKAWALEFKRAVKRAVKRIVDDPLRFGFAPENDGHDQEIRQAPFQTRKGNPYRIVFTVSGRNIYVFSVRGMGQDFVEL